jgi:hypothetical protein
MGAWSSGLLGSDDALDAVLELEKMLDWKPDQCSIRDTKAGELFRARIADLPRRIKVVAYLRKMTDESKNWGAPSILAVVELMLRHDAKIPAEIVPLARWAIDNDEWGKEGDSERLRVLDDFRIRLDAAVVGRPPATRKYRVRMERTIELVGLFDVEAISAEQARELAKAASETAAVVVDVDDPSISRKTGIWVDRLLTRYTRTVRVEGLK